MEADAPGCSLPSCRPEIPHQQTLLVTPFCRFSTRSIVRSLQVVVTQCVTQTAFYFVELKNGQLAMQPIWCQLSTQALCVLTQHVALYLQLAILIRRSNVSSTATASGMASTVSRMSPEPGAYQWQAENIYITTRTSLTDQLALIDVMRYV